LKPAYLWLDTETTGFDVPRVALLEVGAAVVDRDLQVISTFERVVHFDRDKPHPGLKDIKPAVHTMHYDSGLWEACKKSTYDVWEVDAQLSKWARAFFDCGQIQLGGRSIWFDRKVADAFLPTFSECLHGSTFETNTLAHLNRRMGFPPLENPAPHPHRALKDVLGDLADARAYIKRLDYEWP
jgi:oligoribonuclease (3'-5' exoribonuclease)